MKAQHCCGKSLAEREPSPITLPNGLAAAPDSKGHSDDVAMLPGQGEKLTTTA